jgi:glycosyltransferase involved in cell wall biosynthesis
LKNIWILNHYAQEPTGPGGTRHFSLAKNLSEFGWEASIIAASVEHATHRQRISFRENSRLEYFDDIPFLWLWTPPYNCNGIRRVLNMVTYSVQTLTARKVAMLPAPDAIIGSTVHPFAAISADCLAKRYNIPFIFEIRDLWPQTLIDLGKFRESSLQSMFFRAIENYLFRRADRIVTLLPNADEYICQRGVTHDKICWIPNGFESGAGSTDELPVQQNADFTLMYFGSHGLTNQLDTLLDALVILKRRNLHGNLKVRLIGEGPLKGALVARARSENLEFVQFENPVPKRLVPRLASEADGFVFCLADLAIYQYGISLNKLFDYMAAGRPTIISGKSFNNPVKDADAGFTVPPEDPTALAEAIAVLVATPAERRNEMGRNARCYVLKMHDYRNLASRLADLLNETIDQYHPRFPR